MGFLDSAALLLVLAAAFGLFNQHVLRLPFAIGLLVSGLLGSVGVIAANALMPGAGIGPRVATVVLEMDFAHTVLSGMLSLLLFAGALHTDLGKLRQRIAIIGSLASIGVLISTAVAGVVSHQVLAALGVPVPLVWCLAFGALISPTDPIAVLGIMKAAKAPKHLEVKVIGESLFNDGTGVVLFTVLVGVGTATSLGIDPSEALSAGRISLLLAQEILGGIVLGLVTGYLCYRAIKPLDQVNLEILLTVATVFAIGAAATRLHLSGPLAAVTAGLFIGNRGRLKAMSEGTAQSLDAVWTFIDETLNAVLFLMMGLVVLAIDIRGQYLIAGAALIVPVLLARFFGVAIPVFALRLRGEIGAGTTRLLTWGGLKGGVSVALAMKLPEFDGRNALITMTYVVVIFSILVQGMTIGPVIRRLFPAQP